MQKTICELFAGVGGFRLGFDRLASGWQAVWFSQWEPGAKIQWAHDCYVQHYGDIADKSGESHTGVDICTVDKDLIPDHTLLVGGFPCQDYSVAHALTSSQGIEGKKGVLWWQIRDVLITKRPPFCLLENVDRLLKSPARQRGRDFGVILACLSALGYSAEWRVVNAAQYGAAQRRRRTFLFAYRDDTVHGVRMEETAVRCILEKDGLMARSFPVASVEQIVETRLDNDIVAVSDRFAFAFENAGYMHKGTVYTANAVEQEEPPLLLGAALQRDVDEKYYITADKLAKWTYLKGAKKIPRKSANGHEYIFSEGPIAFPDPWDRPGRTMLTSEATLNRSTHIVCDPGTGRLRLLTPVEAERLQGFDDGWTDTGMPDRMRYFCMGNALVVPMITRMGRVLDEIVAQEDRDDRLGRTRKEPAMKDSHSFTRGQLETILSAVVGKTLGEVDTAHVFAKTKTKPKITGIAGDVIEQSVLRYPADQAQRPDLDVDGVPTELKTTGMRLKKTGNVSVYEAKEPASVTAVSIKTIADETFEDSNFWHKAEHLLFVFYQYQAPKTVSAAEYANFYIRGYSFYEFSADDKSIIEHDWQLIHDFIRDIQLHYSEEDAKQKYPELSTRINKQTVYLDTAPKYPHPPRFRLRRRVVTFIIQQSLTTGERLEKLPDRYFGMSDVERKCAELTETFQGQPMAAIMRHFGVEADTAKKDPVKQYAEQVIVRMFGGTAKKISQIEMFRKFGYIGKAVTVTAQGTRTEDTKLFAVDFDELTEKWTEDENGILREKTFEDSDLYQYLHDNKLLCIVFQEDPSKENGEIVLDQNKFIGFKIVDLSDDAIMEAARRTWEDARALISDGRLASVPCKNKNGQQRVTPKTGIPMEAPNLPKSKDHLIFFRGTGQNARNKNVISGVTMLRQYYWIKGAFLVEKLNGLPYIGAHGDH